MLTVRQILFGLFLLFVIYVNIDGLIRMLRNYSIGRPSERLKDRPLKRLWSVFVYAFGQRKMFKEPSTSLHIFIIYGFIILLIPSIQTYIRAFWPQFTLEWIFGKFYGPYIRVADSIGVIILIIVALSLYRRYVLKQVRYIGTKELHRDMDYILLAITAHVVFSWGVHSMEIYEGQFPGAQYATISAKIAPIWGHLTHTQFIITYEIIWWLHAFSVLLTMVYIMGSNAYINKLKIFPSKHFHVIAAFLSIYFRNLDPMGRIPPLNFEDEEAEQFGIGKVEDFTVVDLIQTTACTGCGMCQANCPAFLNDQPLSPKELILDIREHFLKKAPVVLKQRKGKKLNDYEKQILEEKLIGDVVKPESLWACLTCGACMEACPVMIEHVPKIIGMRQDLVMMEGEFPEGVDKIFRNLEVNGNPWGIGKHLRGDWVKEVADEINVPYIEDKPEAEYLFWVGCFGSFDDRTKKVTKSLAKILNKAGVSFAILGKEEKCTGDPARRLGNEYLAQMLIMENVETLNSHNIKKILTFCPHCYNTFKNEYPDFGGKYEVIHAVELLNDLLKQGKIRVKQEVMQKITYHDSCYLGRYNKIFDAPREIIKQIHVTEFKEMEKNKEKAMCCGAGGGRMWWDSKEGTPINKTRVEMAVKTGADTIAVSCPFCMVMLEDGVIKADVNDKVQVQDIIEIIAANLEK